MKKLAFVASIACALGLVAGPAKATVDDFTVTAEIISAGDCDPSARLFVALGQFDPFFETVRIVIEYPDGQRERVGGTTSSDGYYVFISRAAVPPPLFGGRTTITGFIDRDFDFEPDAGSRIATASVSYCAPTCVVNGVARTIADGSVNGGRGDDTIVCDTVLPLVIDGGQGADTLRGGSGDDVIRGGQGDDVLDGGDGVDSIDGGQGADSMDGGDGAVPPGDRCDGGKGPDTAVRCETLLLGQQ